MGLGFQGEVYHCSNVSAVLNVTLMFCQKIFLFSSLAEEAITPVCLSLNASCSVVMIDTCKAAVPEQALQPDIVILHTIPTYNIFQRR